MLHPHIPRALALAVLFAVLPAAGADADGSRADYARIESLRKKTENAVWNQRLHEVWVNAETLVYRQENEQGWRFLRVDANTGKRTDAFDHERLAAALGGDAEEGLDPQRLPVQPMGLAKGALLLRHGTRVFAVAPDTAAVEERALDDIPSLALEPDGARRSRGSGEDTALLFVNRSSQAIDLLWLDHGGAPRKYVTLASGKTHRQHTFPGHAWLVRAADGSKWGSYTAQASPRVVFVTGPPSKRAKPEPKRGAAVSPDGRYRALIRENNVFLRDRRTKQEMALSTDGTTGDRYRARWSWSPDSRYLVAVQERPAQEHPVHVVNSVPKDSFQPKLRTFNYLKPGDRIAEPRPRIFNIRTQKPVAIDEALFAQPWAINHFQWTPDGKRFLFHYNQRGHQVVRVVELDPKKKQARALIEEKSQTFIDYSQKTWMQRIDEGRSLLWMSERSGWNHLYRIDTGSGEAMPLTRGDWVVRKVISVDEAAGHLEFEALGVHAGEDPYHVHVGRADLKGKGVTWLTAGDGSHRLSYSPDRRWYVDTWSRMDLPPVHVLRRSTDASLVAELEKAEWAPLLATGWQPTQVVRAKGRDGKTDIWGVIHRPSTFDPKQRYPVIEQIYAGPHGHFVPKPFRVWSEAKALAELGFIVVQIDGMGTNWRSKAFHDVCWKNLGDAGFPDRIAWIQSAAKTRPWMDLERVGIYGGSAGGQSALRALLAHAEFYDVGVADCGCHDNRMDKIWWNEAWMGWPVGPHYEEQSNVTQAHRLTGKLLLIVGEIDQNVDPASTYKVVDALIKADKDFDLLVIPGQGHGAAGTAYGRRRQRDFFVRHLLGVEPRHE